MESRQRDAAAASGSNEDFLRGCDIRIYIEYDVAPHLDRAIDLINRTNQLNFTKIRLPEQIGEARANLRSALDDHIRHCGSGLVRVVDKYGDHGFVGFFMLMSGTMGPASDQLTKRLEHYCFSCRTLGMLVEQWLYDHLHRPDIKIVGEVLSDLSVPRTIDWIRPVDAPTSDGVTVSEIAPEIRIHGGCEINAIAHYLGAHSKSVTATGNFHAGKTFVRVNGSSLLLSASDRRGPLFEQEASRLGIPYPMLVSNFFSETPKGTLFVFGGQLDIDNSFRYRHKLHGWEIFVEAHGLWNVNLVTTPAEEIERFIETLDFDTTVKNRIRHLGNHIRENYENIVFRGDTSLVDLMHELFARVPIGSKLILLLDHQRVRDSDGNVMNSTCVQDYADRIRSIAMPFPFVGVVSFDNAVENDDDIRIGGNHYDRMVYYRMAQCIVRASGFVAEKTRSFSRSHRLVTGRGQ
jgi:hypothetical protein